MPGRPRHRRMHAKQRDRRTVCPCPPATRPMLLANKFKAAANPVEKILILAEHAPLVEAIKIAKSNPPKNNVTSHPTLSRSRGRVSFVRLLPAQQSRSSTGKQQEGSSPPQGKLSSAQRRRRFIQNPIKWRNNRPSQCMSTTGVPMAL
ncbi:hypothetical protein EVAR_87954_1 [Eumeta japonica]|uniref:Uncharacterized protein n=1 Tax=Eumeta variegata TaxID=151549 RepID=A0A4C1VFD3_EUMVA|nr:hypothetical protein EVAR_87954_1 [Eumeta japonica]